jgi:hypothetical protein
MTGLEGMFGGRRLGIYGQFFVGWFSLDFVRTSQ